MTTDKVAGRTPWHPTSREKRARCGPPDLMSPVQNACHLIFQLAAASRLLGMTKKERVVVRRGRLLMENASPQPQQLFYLFTTELSLGNRPFLTATLSFF